MIGCESELATIKWQIFQTFHLKLNSEVFDTILAEVHSHVSFLEVFIDKVQMDESFEPSDCECWYIFRLLSRLRSYDLLKVENLRLSFATHKYSVLG
jgi:hypothetical protein